MAPTPGITSLIMTAPGVPGQIILSPQVAPALPTSPVTESTATMEKVCCDSTENGKITAINSTKFLIIGSVLIRNTKTNKKPDTTYVISGLSDYSLKTGYNLIIER